MGLVYAGELLSAARKPLNQAKMFSTRYISNRLRVAEKSEIDILTYRRLIPIRI